MWKPFQFFNKIYSYVFIIKFISQCVGSISPLAVFHCCHTATSNEFVINTNIYILCVVVLLITSQNKFAYANRLAYAR